MFTLNKLIPTRGGLKRFGYRALIALVLAVAIASVPTHFTDSRMPFIEKSVREAIVVDAAKENATCPLNAEEIRRADIESIAICRKHGLAAYAAVRERPEWKRIFVIYTEVPEFQQIFDDYGKRVLPVIAFFVDKQSNELEARHWMSEAWDQFRQGKNIKDIKVPELKPEQFGLMAIYEIKNRGHKFLAEFEIVDHVAKRKLLTRIIFSGLHLFLGNISHLETVLTRRERDATLAEYGWALYDSALFVGTASAVLNVAKAGGKAAAKTAVKTGAKSAGATTFGIFASVGKAAMPVLVPVTTIGALYIGITRPALWASGAGWVAEMNGLPREFGIFVAYALPIFLLLLWIGPRATFWLLGLVPRALVWILWSVPCAVVRTCRAIPRLFRRESV